jgi:hypothetical protein
MSNVGLVVLVVTAGLVGAASRLKPCAASTLYCPMLISSALWSCIAFLFTPAQMGFHALMFYTVFFAAGLASGIQELKLFHYFDKRIGNPITAFWVVLPFSLVIGVVFWGLMAGLLVSDILLRISEWKVSGASLGMTIGFLASLTSYIVWRVVVKIVWR